MDVFNSNQTPNIDLFFFLVFQQVMTASFGTGWSSIFSSFDRIPFAAASIGQVHSAVLVASLSPTGKDEEVAVKIQFPNIANSIESDLGYISMLLTVGKLLPKGLFLDSTIKVSVDHRDHSLIFTRTLFR